MILNRITQFPESERALSLNGFNSRVGTGVSSLYHARPSMRPVTLNGSFGWLHTSSSAIGGSVAVLICTGLDRDMLDSHQALRLLADQFATIGYPAMRFDYPGTGDSCNIEQLGVAPIEHWSAWQKSVLNAADWLLLATGASRLVLCGLRVGATIATFAAEHRDDVVGLILMAPVLRGQSYMVQLRMEAKLRGYSRATFAGGLNLQELQFSAATLDYFKRADLRQARLPADCKIAVFSQTASTLLNECIQAWSFQNAEVTCFSFDEMEPMLQHNLLISVIPANFSSVLEWLRVRLPAQPIIPLKTPVASAVLSRPGWIETPLQFGNDQALFGMLCQPDSCSSKAAVIICNTGRDPHYGFARFAVELSRRLALEGFASLRIDFSGLGDSIGPAGQENILSPMFDTNRANDISAAVDVLQQLGYSRFVLQGLCAGAFHAFQGALADFRISTLLLINIPFFTWRSGDTVDWVGRKLTKPSRYLLQVTNRKSWKNLLQGKVNFRAILLAQGARLIDQKRGLFLRISSHLGYFRAPSAMCQALTSLFHRRVQLLLIFSQGDVGIDAVTLEFGSLQAAARKFKNVSIKVVSGADHTLGNRAIQINVEGIIVRFLTTGAKSDHSGS